MMKYLLLFLAGVALGKPAETVTLVKKKEVMSYEDFKQIFHPAREGLYNLAALGISEEEDVRRAQFEKNIQKIKHQNMLNDMGKSGYRFGVNQFADLSEDEFAKMLNLGQPMPKQNKRNDASFNLPKAASDSVDWRQKNAVTPVKNQGQCGSCWSFSATGAMEGAVAVASGTLVSLSEKQLMDCSKSYGNNSCSGGLMDYAFRYVIANGGIDSEKDYPYSPQDGTCQSTKESTKVASIKGYQDVPANSASSMLSAVAQGPVSIAIEADRSAFQLYSGGVLDTADCGTNLDHGVLIVGYTATDDASYPNAWIVKNSWGGTWGVQGYLYISRETNTSAMGICGILENGSYATGGSVPNPQPHPSPSPGPSPKPGTKYYENPYTGACSTNEFNVTLSYVNQETQGAICSPTCGNDHSDYCPTPENSEITATPSCILESTMLQLRFCALECLPYGSSKQCGSDQKCQITCDTGTNTCKYACMYTYYNAATGKEEHSLVERLTPAGDPQETM